MVEVYSEYRGQKEMKNRYNLGEIESLLDCLPYNSSSIKFSSHLIFLLEIKPTWKCTILLKTFYFLTFTTGLIITGWI